MRGKSGTLSIGEILGHRPTQRAVIVDEYVGQPPVAALFGPVLPTVKGPAGLGRTTGHHNSAHVRRLEHPKRCVGEVLGALDEFEAEPKIRLV